MKLYGREMRKIVFIHLTEQSLLEKTQAIVNFLLQQVNQFDFFVLQIASQKIMKFGGKNAKIMIIEISRFWDLKSRKKASPEPSADRVGSIIGDHTQRPLQVHSHAAPPKG